MCSCRTAGTQTGKQTLTIVILKKHIFFFFMIKIKLIPEIVFLTTRLLCCGDDVSCSGCIVFLLTLSVQFWQILPCFN